MKFKIVYTGAGFECKYKAPNILALTYRTIRWDIENCKMVFTPQGVERLVMTKQDALNVIKSYIRSIVLIQVETEERLEL